MKKYMEPAMEVIRLETPDILYESVADNDFGWNVLDDEYEE